MPGSPLHDLDTVPARGFIAAVPANELLLAHQPLVDRMRLAFGVDRDTFDQDVMPLLERYAACVHQLPATPDSHFSEPGGLLRLGLEVAFFALQGTDAHIFSGRSTISVRRQLEPRWRLATFIGGLCCELHRTLGLLVVMDPDGREWPACLAPLAGWLQGRGIERYQVCWRADVPPVQAQGLFVLPHVVPPRVMQFLGKDNAVIVPHLLASIAGLPLYRDRNVLDTLVRRSLALVVDRDLRTRADRTGTAPAGTHLARYLVEAMQALARGHAAWVPNRDKARLWLGQDGLFLAWPQAAADVQAELEAAQLAGMPKSAPAMLAPLLAAGVLEPRDAQGATWAIQPPGVRTPVEAVKLSSPDLLLAGITPCPAPLPVPLARDPGPPAHAPDTPPAASAHPAKAQLSLLDADPAPASATVEPPPAAPPARPPQTAPGPRRRALSLGAPLRLDPVVRDAVSKAVKAIGDGTRAPASHVTADGFFVPFEEVERHGIDAAQARHALGDAGMLVQPEAGDAAVVTHDLDGRPRTGLLIQLKFVRGLDLADFAPASPPPGD